MQEIDPTKSSEGGLDFRATPDEKQKIRNLVEKILDLEQDLGKLKKPDRPVSFSYSHLEQKTAEDLYESEKTAKESRIKSIGEELLRAVNIISRRNNPNAPLITTVELRGLGPINDNLPDDIKRIMYYVDNCAGYTQVCRVTSESELPPPKNQTVKRIVLRRSDSLHGDKDPLF
jgi:hypothetical protein